MHLLQQIKRAQGYRQDSTMNVRKDAAYLLQYVTSPACTMVM
jgi:hypothetical protein